MIRPRLLMEILARNAYRRTDAFGYRCWHRLCTVFGRARGAPADEDV